MVKPIWLLALVLCGCTPAESPEASFGGVWQQAKLRGVSFRAIGQEPGWLLEITDSSEILLVTDYGKACHDSMSGEEFAVTVTVTVGEDRMSGCGRALY